MSGEPYVKRPVWVNPYLLESTFLPYLELVEVRENDPAGGSTTLHIDDDETGGVLVTYDGEALFVSESLPDVLGGLEGLCKDIIIEIRRQQGKPPPWRVLWFCFRRGAREYKSCVGMTWGDGRDIAYDRGRELMHRLTLRRYEQ